MGIESEPGVDRFTFHYYTSAGRPVLGVRTLVWGGDDWPAVGEDLAEGTYKITADNGLTLGVRDAGAADGSVIELQPYSGSDFQKWNVAVSPEGYYRLSSVGSGKVFEVGANQQWIIELLSDGKTYCLKPRSSQEALGFRAEKPAAAALTTTAWSNLASQKWTFGAP
jgi:hypothetical protein